MITILEQTTKEPITLMGKMAGVCWNANVSDKEKNYKRGIDCLESGHGRVLEYPNVYMIIDGYSAKCLREYYTHIGGMPTRLQASTRYIDYSKGDGFSYTTPKSIANDKKALEQWEYCMSLINNTISTFINTYNVPTEDATMMLPLAYTSKMVDKRNLRNLIDMSHQRMCTRAYWEYRQLFNEICNALIEYSDEWAYLVKNYFKPKCEVYGYCEEKKSCGRKEKKNEARDY